jgi:serine/threonine-protein kinase
MTVSMLGRYQIVAQLGRGAMGTVYRALDPAIERTVAIKTLNPDLPDENLPEVRERFLREAKSAGRLNHPNVVTVYDVGEADGIAYIAMEYLEGRSLRQVLDAGAPLAVHAVTDIVSQIADALDYAQRFGIVHRDIKPANIMLSPAGLAKLTDFGVAYMPSSSMTQTGTVLGSPKYLSPEQVLGLPVDGRADIFALGVVLFEMLAGRTPFERPDITVYALMQSICTDPAPRITELKRDIPAAFDGILARALGKRPDERYQRAGEFASDLRNYRRLAESAAAEKTMIAPAAAVEATVVVRPGAAPAVPPPAPDPEMEQRMSQLLSDLETFSFNFEEEQRKLAEKAAAMMEERARAEAEAAQPQDATSSRPKARSALVGLLQGQAKGKARAQPARPTLETVLALDAKLRQAFDILSEFVSEFNDAGPAFAGKLKLPYAGELPELTMGDGFVDFRTVKFMDKPVIDHIALTYRMSSDEKLRVTLNKDEARMLKLQLERTEMKFEEQDVVHFLHRVPRTALSIECTVIARARLRADYDGQAVEFLCQNIGAIGAARYRVAAARVDEDAIEEFGKRLLGLPNRFAELAAGK